MPRIHIKDLDSTEKGPGSDMALYFNHTLLRVSSDGKTSWWAQYNGLGHTGHVFVDAKGNKHIIPPDNDKAFVEWSFPTGWFNTKKSAVYCERIPKRQYLKGIHVNSNFRLTSAESIAKDCGILKSENLEVCELLDSISMDSKVFAGVEFMEATFGVEYPSLEDSYLLLKARKVFCRALNREFSMLPHPKTKDFVVMCHDMPVAEMVTKNKLKMLLPEFKPECIAYFQKEGVVVV